VNATEEVAVATITANGSASPVESYAGAGQAFVSFSPDGTRLVWVENRTVWTADSDGANAHQLTPSGQQWTCPSWAADSSFLLVDRRLSSGQWVLARVPLTGGQPTDLTSPLAFNVSPCGRYLDPTHILVIGIDPQPNVYAVYLMTADGADKRLFAVIPRCGINEAAPSPDHTQVLLNVEGCANPYTDGVWTMSASGGTPRQVTTGLTAAPTWTADGHDLLFAYAPLGTNPDQTQLWAASIDGNQARKLISNSVSGPAAA
jgi:hypothetical protein